MTDWINIPDNISEYVGFVYIIWQHGTGKFYLGQKKYWFKRKLRPLKGKKRFRHKLVESDWKTYYGSCEALLDDIKKYGKYKFSRKILFNLKAKSLMNYIETKMLFEYDVLLNDKSYNRIINCRINQNQLSNKAHTIAGNLNV